LIWDYLFCLSVQHLEPLVEGEEHKEKFDMNDMNAEISVSVPTDDEADDEANASQLEGGDATSV
jgi:hypothetical protein